MARSKFDFSGLSAAERLQLVEDLWDSLADDDIELTSAQEKEILRRRDRLDHEGTTGRPWQDVMDELGQHEA